ncbi:6191_t:CDS:2 [Entrophospora sp. SA101]|nr:13864_t:CDS:2 [Entrophospora sp. SA101]CAJ0913172.1 6191_t:CDS:2 [Entrophospora sp. SA101]
MENSTLKNTTIVFRHKMYTKGFSPEQNELSYREAFVNPIIARSFNDSAILMFVFSLTKFFKRLSTGGSCISNTLSNGRVAHYTTQVNCEKGFFDQKRELVKFKNVFNANSQLHVVLGPHSNGKTALIHKPFSGDPFSEKEITSNDVMKLLDNIENALPKWTCWDSYNIPPPILFIDEANMFSQLGSSKEGEVLLKSILNWVVVNTKEKRRFHVVLTSSDSFFFNWIVKLLHIPHATPYVVGDLSREEAEEYFLKCMSFINMCKELRGKFDRIHRMTDYDFSVYESEYNRLICVKAEDQGFVLENDLIEAIGPDQVNSLIDHNYLHRRPTRRFANDIIGPPAGEVILTAMNQPSVRAMERILSKVSSRKK